MPELWDIFPSSVNPAELHFVVRTAVTNAKEGLRNPTVGATYGSLEIPKEFPENTILNGKVAKDFVLTIITKPKENFLEWRFAPSKTVAELRVPFRSYSNNVPYGWPAVVYNPIFDVDRSNPRISENADGVLYLPRGVVEYRWKNAAHRYTDIKVEMFTSPTPFPKALMKCNEPLPKPVEWDYYGDRAQFPSALHAKIEVPPQRLFNYQAGSEVNTHQRRGQTFKATNFEDWSVWEVNEEEYIASEGIYLRTRTVYHPPPDEEDEVR